MIPEREREDYLDEIERSIQIYDSTIETGNEVLDTVLTEKSLYCEQHQITMTCVADATLSMSSAATADYVFTGAQSDQIGRAHV